MVALEFGDQVARGKNPFPIEITHGVSLDVSPDKYSVGMTEAPIEYVGRTIMNVLLRFDKDPAFQKTMEEQGLSFTLRDALQPIVDTTGIAGSSMLNVYKVLSWEFELDKVNDDDFSGTWESLRWPNEESMRGPNCGSCQNRTTAILYGMPGEDFDFENFVSGGCIVSDDAPIWVCRNCGWEI